jgi:hypothetical protein
MPSGSRFEAEVIPPVEILNIKWVELHDKWGKFVPQEKKPQWRYYVEDPGPERRKKVKQNVKDSKTTQKGRTRTNDDDAVKPKKYKGDSIEGPENPTGAI